MQTHFMRRVGVRAPLPDFPSALVMCWSPWRCSSGRRARPPTRRSWRVRPRQAPSCRKLRRTVRLTFNESVSPLLVKIVEPDGSVRDITQTRVLPGGLEVPLPILDQQGAYGLSWHVVSADGHRFLGQAGW